MQKLPMKNKSRGCCAKCLCGSLLYTFFLLLILFITVFVIIPLVFKYSTGIQRSLIFPAWVVTPKNYSDIEAFRIKGVKNFYVDLEKDDNITLGVWQILPQEMLSELIENHDYNYDGALTSGNYNILLYMHGNGADRASSLELYDVLRKYFHIFAVDYRGYGDSSMGDMTVTDMVDDIQHLYSWLRSRSSSKIFVWGHSLGTGVGTNLVANLANENISAQGLILETPFTSVTDVMQSHPIAKIYSFLPWFKATIIQPIVDNDLNFDPKKFIIDVNCPIMILHAKDDTIIPYRFATELYNTAVNDRNTSYQGNVTYHLFEEKGYDHMNIYKAPELPSYVSDFIDECDKFEKKVE